jgi:hypothetical protein
MRFSAFTQRALRALPLWIGLNTLWADVTVRYQWDMKFSPSMPAQVQEMAKNQLASQGMVLYFKDGKGYYKHGKLVILTDYTNKQVTLIDTEHKSYATAGFSDFSDKMAAAVNGMMPSVPESAQRAMAETKTETTTRSVETSDAILGIQADEKELVLTVQPPGGTGMSTRMVMQFWTPKPAEAMRNAGVREVVGYNLYANRFMNPMEGIRKMSEIMPGMTNNFKPLMEEFSQKNLMMLRMKISNYIQISTEMLKNMGEHSPFGPDYDPNSPLSEITMNLTELSTAPVDSAIFQIPEGFQSAPVEDLVKSAMAAMMPDFGRAK